MAAQKSMEMVRSWISTGIVFVCIQTADIYTENDMVAAVTVGLGVSI